MDCPKPAHSTGLLHKYSTTIKSIGLISGSNLFNTNRKGLHHIVRHDYLKTLKLVYEWEGEEEIYMI